MFARLLYYLVLGRLWPKEGKKVRFFIAKSNQKDMIFLKEIIEAGKLRPVVDRRCSLTETADAMRYLKEGHARGKVVISVTDGSQTEQEKIPRQLEELRKK